MKKLKRIFTLIMFLFIMMLSCNSYAVSPDGDIEYQGIDVSVWQGYIDYSRVRESGVDIVYIKATQGTNYKDPYFELNYENAKANGLKVGVYHFVMARTTEEARLEAEFFASVISGKNIDCKLAMDFEEFGTLSTLEINEISRAFLERLEEITKKDAVVYSDLYNSQRTFTLANNYPLWIAYYGGYRELENIESNWEFWQGQQYTDMGIVDGISGYVDRDQFTEEILLEDTSKIPEFIAPKEENISERIEYIVQRGNTLWELARKYDVSIDEIARLNNIQNPNLIYVGEKLTIITNTNFEDVNTLNKTLYTVKSGDTLSELAIKFNTTVENIVKLNDIQNPNLIYVGQRLRI